jgi:hypothetical protein
VREAERERQRIATEQEETRHGPNASASLRRMPRSANPISELG